MENNFLNYYWENGLGVCGLRGHMSCKMDRIQFYRHIWSHYISEYISESIDAQYDILKFPVKIEDCFTLMPQALHQQPGGQL